MHEIEFHLNQLPTALHWEIYTHAGDTTGLAPHQLAAHYRAVAQNLIAQARARYQPLEPNDPDMVEIITVRLYGTDLDFIKDRSHGTYQRWATYEIIKYLETFARDLAPVQSRLEREAHQRVVEAAQEAARQLAQRQAEEAARQLAQRQAEEAARVHAQQQAQEAARQLAQRQAHEAAARQMAQRQAEEAARQLAQQQAAEAARLAAEAAARQLAQQQAQAAALAFAQRAAEEQTLREARLALELSTASAPVETPIDGEIKDGEPAARREDANIRFIPGPAATKEIEQATVKLKRSIDAAVDQFASDIGPYLKLPEAGASLTTGA